MAKAFTLITGASSGFGRSIALRMSAGHRLILAGRNNAALSDTRNGCSFPERHLVWVRDLGKLEGIGNELVAFLTEHDAEVEHFVHSAGVMAVQFSRGLQLDTLKHLFSVNVFSALEMLKPLMRKRVNHEALRTVTFLSSVVTRVGASGYSVYAASKGALNGVSLSLAVELAPTVRVNCVLPGIVDTEMNSHHFADSGFVQSVLDTHPLGLGKPDDIADVVEFLSSDHARWITGQEIVVDGGRTIVSPPRATPDPTPS